MLRRRKPVKPMARKITMKPVSQASPVQLGDAALQDACGYSPLHAGLAMLPMPAVMAVCAPVAGLYVARHGARLPLLAGGAAVAAGSSAIAWSLARGSAGSFALPYAVLGLGAGLCSPSLTNTIMGGLPAARAAVASSIELAGWHLVSELHTQ
jgi:MFS family permease